MLELVEKIAETWNSQGLRYAVLSGLERYPKSLGRDLDIVVADDDDAHRLLQIAEEAFLSRGFRLAYPPDTWGRRIVAFDGTHGIEIHTMERLTWAFTTLYEKPHPDLAVGPFETDTHGTFVKRVVLPLLGGDDSKVKAARAPLDDGQIEAQLQTLLRGASNADAANLAALIRSEEAADLEEARRRLKKLLTRQALGSGAGQMVARAAGLWRARTKRLRHKCGVMIAVVGPDGVGKSSLTRAILDMDHGVFTSVRLRHWRPGILPELRRFTKLRRSEAREDTAPPRRRAGRLYWVRLLYYALDFYLGHWTKDRWILGRQAVLMYDRCFLDMAVDPVRYGLSSNRGMMRVWKRLPKPDRIILLRDTPERIHARKPELSIAEIRRQLEEWQKLVESGQVHSVLEVDRSAEELARKVKAMVVDTFIDVNRPDPRAGRGTGRDRS